MFESLFCGTCKIYRRKATEKYGTKAGDKYDLFNGSGPCNFLDKIGKTIPNDGSGRDIILDGEFRMSIEPLVTDKIEYNGYDYVVSEVQEKSDIITQIIQYYRATVTRQRKSNETPVVVN